MPTIDFDIDTENHIAEENVSQNSNNTDSSEVTFPDFDESGNGLSLDEERDPNKIKVTIADKEAPLLILFGPPSSGKTMTLVRLTRFLQKNGYTISPVRNFRPTQDYSYTKLCDSFNEIINSDTPSDHTDKINFMLVQILKNGKRICQILEAPGEYYHNPKIPSKPFPNYVNTIINSNNRKIWALIVEPDWENEVDRKNYVSKIEKLKHKLRSSDRIIFVFNKIDKTEFVFAPGQVHRIQALKEVQNLYPNIFVPFKNQNPITKFISEYRFDFVPFQTGEYVEAEDGSFVYGEAQDEYPRQLWNVVLKRIKG